MNLQIQVAFNEAPKQEKVVLDICDLGNPHIILWYIGTNGLKKRGAEFYRDILIDPILAKNKKSSFILVDLTAWGALRSSNISLSHFSNHEKTINEFNIEQIRCIKSSDTFKKIQKIENPEIVKYFTNALKRQFIQKPSLNVDCSGFTLRSLFSEDCPLIHDWLDIDASKTYSPLQYLEAIILIEDILKNTHEKSLDIVFALPNDELKYYRDEDDSFKKDLSFFIKHNGNLLSNRNITVLFYSFPYGEIESHRPYNAPGEVIKKGRLTKDLIVSPKVLSAD